MKSKDIVLIGLLTAILYIGKLVFDFLPNVEVITTLLIIYSICFGKRATWVAFIFCMITGVMYGFGSWLLVYFVVYPGLTLLSRKFKKALLDSIFLRCLLSAAFGLSFGLWFALEWAAMYGISAGIAYYLNGVYFDLLHMIGNFVVMAVISDPLIRVFRRYAKNTTHIMR